VPAEAAMMSDEFDRRMRAKMEVALERACRDLSERGNTHDNRKRVAQSLIDCARSGRTTLTDLTAAARQTVFQIKTATDSTAAAMSGTKTG